LCPQRAKSFALVSHAISAKDPLARGNSPRTVTRVSFLVLASALAIAALGRAHPARAEPCPPAVALTGDDDAVAAVRAQLDARGIGPETARGSSTAGRSSWSRSPGRRALPPVSSAPSASRPPRPP
jgi:hypothetical protein